jgi:histidine triad (HIT) family protein
MSSGIYRRKAMTRTIDPDCLFCQIVAGQTPATVVYKTDQVTAFRDIQPQLPTHVLVVPNQHIANTEVLEPADDRIVGAVIRAAREIARQEGLSERGYRLVLNTGPDALNSVAHLHVHLLGGRVMGWPPG